MRISTSLLELLASHDPATDVYIVAIFPKYYMYFYKLK